MSSFSLKLMVATEDYHPMLKLTSYLNPILATSSISLSNLLNQQSPIFAAWWPSWGREKEMGPHEWRAGTHSGAGLDSHERQANMHACTARLAQIDLCVHVCWPTAHMV